VIITIAADSTKPVVEKTEEGRYVMKAKPCMTRNRANRKLRAAVYENPAPIFGCILLVAMLILLPQFLRAADHQGHMAKGASEAAASPGSEKAAYPTMVAPGKKMPLGNDYYLVYGFDKKPKLGTVIMKVEIFGPQGAKDTSFEVTADAGMPSMKGAHETGERPFVLSKKGDYLLPINIVMPGDWEVRMTVSKEGKVVFRGSYQFDV
jgi:hypothetical protein